eukprot:92611-Prymnesium_polylepis.1
MEKIFALRVSASMLEHAEWTCHDCGEKFCNECCGWNELSDQAYRACGIDPVGHIGPESKAIHGDGEGHLCTTLIESEDTYGEELDCNGRCEECGVEEESEKGEEAESKEGDTDSETCQW